MLLFDVAPAVAVVIGGAVAMSSTAIIIAQLTEQSENNRTHGRLAVAICLFQDLSFPLFLALVSVLSGGRTGADAAHIGGAIGIAMLALLLVLAAGRWLLRPLFLVIASVRSAELFSLAVLLAVLASAWATHAVGLSLALGAFLAGMMLAETEFRHQVEATIRSYREVLLGLFFITVGMLLDVGLLLRHFPLVAAILARNAAAQGGGGDPWPPSPPPRAGSSPCAPASWSRQGGEFGFALLTLLLRRELLDQAIVQPLLAATVLSMVLSPIIIRHNRRITRALLRRIGSAAKRGDARNAGDAGRRRPRPRRHLRFWPCRAEYRARARANGLRVHRARRGRLPYSRRQPGRRSGGLRRCRPGQGVGKRRDRACQLSWSSPSPIPKWRCASCGRCASCAPMCRSWCARRTTPSSTELQAAGATEVVPETFEASLMLLSHLLLLLKLPVRAGDPHRQRHSQPSLRHAAPVLSRCATPSTWTRVTPFARSCTASSCRRRPGRWGAALRIWRRAAREATVSAVRRDGIVGREPSPDTLFKEGDVVVVCGTPEAVEHAETLLLMG